MNKQQQLKITKMLLENLTHNILKKVEHFPDDWSGMQIRQYIQDFYNQHFNSESIMIKKTKQNYNNDLLINPNL